LDSRYCKHHPRQASTIWHSINQRKDNMFNHSTYISNSLDKSFVKKGKLYSIKVTHSKFCQKINSFQLKENVQSLDRSQTGWLMLNFKLVFGIDDLEESLLGFGLSNSKSFSLGVKPLDSGFSNSNLNLNHTSSTSPIVNTSGYALPYDVIDNKQMYKSSLSCSKSKTHLFY
jgi:hypothetical protein